MRTAPLCLLPIVLLTGCTYTSRVSTATSEKQVSLSEARRDFKTKLVPQEAARRPVEVPPPKLFRIVQYPSPVGNLAAYLSPDPGDKQKHPAIIWMHGGDCNSIDGDCWKEGFASNDQSAHGFRDAGIIMMFPSLRGGNENPGVKEGFFGEVDDVLAAADWLAQQEFVDPGRIYLGGHGEGGTLVLLVAACSDRFRAVFSFGPVSDVSEYKSEYLPFDKENPREIEIRSPGHWLHSIQSPTHVFEGNRKPSNITSIAVMMLSSTNPKLHFHPINGEDHFSILAPTTELVARRILADQGMITNIAFPEEREIELPGR
jgi:dipeptidyl aminopeptidase/acylaminoacyl peptidase